MSDNEYYDLVATKYAMKDYAQKMARRLGEAAVNFANNGMDFEGYKAAIANAEQANRLFEGAIKRQEDYNATVIVPNENGDEDA